MVVDLCGILFDEGILRARNAGEGKGGGKVYIMWEGGKLWVGWGAFGAFESSDFDFTLLIIYYPAADPKGH